MSSSLWTGRLHERIALPQVLRGMLVIGMLYLALRFKSSNLLYNTVFINKPNKLRSTKCLVNLF